MKIHCRFCDRYLFTQAGSVVIEDMVCSNSSCKAHLNFKLVVSDQTQDLRHKFVNKEKQPKKKAKKETIAK